MPEMLNIIKFYFILTKHTQQHCIFLQQLSHIFTHTHQTKISFVMQLTTENSNEASGLQR